MNPIIDIENLISGLIKDNPDRINRVYGRILKGKVSEEFETLTYCPDKRYVVMLLDHEGLMQINGLPALDALDVIGYPKDYTKKVIDEGYKFKIIIFEDESNVKLATWDNAIDVIGQVYPQWTDKLHRQLPLLKTVPYEEIQKMAGELLDVRQFLHDAMNFNHLYTGDGFTQPEDGGQGVREYAMVNCPISSLSNYIIHDLKI